MKIEFAEGGKPEYPEKNPRSQIEIDKSQPTCEAWEAISGRRGGRCYWWALCQPESPDNDNDNDQNHLQPELMIMTKIIINGVHDLTSSYRRRESTKLTFRALALHHLKWWFYLYVKDKFFNLKPFFTSYALLAWNYKTCMFIIF